MVTHTQYPPRTNKRGRKPVKPEAPELLTRIPEPPEDLHEYGKAYWREIAPQLIEQKRLAETYLASLEMLCAAYATYRLAKERLQDPDQWVSGGQVKRVNPYYTIVEKERKTYLSLAQQFALQPLADATLSAKPSSGGSAGARELENFTAQRDEEDG